MKRLVISRVPGDYESRGDPPLLERLPKGFWKALEYALLLAMVVTLVFGGVI